MNHCQFCGRYLSRRRRYCNDDCRRAAARRDRKLAAEERIVLTTLHEQSDGSYRVGATPFFIRPHKQGDWGIYTFALDGWRRIPGEWAFPKFEQAEKRAWAFAENAGY